MLGSYIAIGDSFTEGLGDPRRDGSLRGWADRVAGALALERAAEAGAATEEVGPTGFDYANLAIRGRKVLPVIDQQVKPAMAQHPDLISFNAGGNNMLRPKFDPTETVEAIVEAVTTMRDSGSHVLVLAGPDPVNNLPMGETFSARGTTYTELCASSLDGMRNVTFVDNFHDRAFEDSTYWSEDGLHLGPAGHLRVAANCLDALGVTYPKEWGDPREPQTNPKDYSSAQYFGKYVAPWIGRRLTGRSSGDGRVAKRPLLKEFDFRWDG